jgi:hypothetical protein
MASGMNISQILQTLLPIVEALEQLGVAYHLGGSVASSLHGEARSTQDIDLVANLQAAHVRHFVALLNQDYYLDESSIRDAIRRQASFNAIFLDTGMKIDVFIPKARAFDQDELQHIHYLPLERGGRSFPVSSPEAMILRKLEWYEMGGRVSKRQWGDLIGILQKKAATLDLIYLDRWARVLRVDDLPEQALQEAGLARP